jgi:Ca-activated chloride channel family protein
MKAAARFVACLLLTVPLYSQRQPYTLTVDVDLVVLNVRVLDKSGQSMHGLAKENFYIEEDGKRQSIDLFIGEDSPATIGLVLDSSSSMNSKQADVEAAALRFIQSSQPSDQVFVLRFNDKLHWALPQNQPFTDDIDLLKQALQWKGPGGRTALYDAIGAALTHSARGRWEKRALIVLTDGGDNASSRTLPGVLRFAQESNVTIYTIGLFDPLAVGSSRPVLHKLAALTGGDSYSPATIEDLAPVWDQIAHGIRTQYTLGYRPTQTFFDGKFHKIRVRVDLPGHGKVTVHTRPGYLARNAAVEP